MGLDPRQFAIMEMRLAKQNPVKCSDAVELENDLHADIIKFCAGKGWMYFHSRTDRKTRRKNGEPDFCILCHNGKTLFIEAKAKSGKLSPEQLGIKLWAQKLGHTIHTVYSMQDFINAISTTPKQ